MSETPRTDAAQWTETNAANALVLASFARELERENTELRGALINARASFLGLQPDTGGPIAAQMGKAIQRINDALNS